MHREYPSPAIVLFLHLLLKYPVVVTIRLGTRLDGPQGCSFASCSHTLVLCALTTSNTQSESFPLEMLTEEWLLQYRTEIQKIRLLTAFWFPPPSVEPACMSCHQVAQPLSCMARGASLHGGGTPWVGF